MSKPLEHTISFLQSILTMAEEDLLRANSEKNVREGEERNRIHEYYDGKAAGLTLAVIYLKGALEMAERESQWATITPYPKRGE